jgi:hypothetical protein
MTTLYHDVSPPSSHSSYVFAQGSVIVRFVILPAADGDSAAPTVEEVAASFSEQAADENSDLRTLGTYARALDNETASVELVTTEVESSSSGGSRCVCVYRVASCRY